MNRPTCPECGNAIDERSMVLECEYCLSKKKNNCSTMRGRESSLLTK